MIARHFRFHGYGSLNFVYRKGRSVRRGSLTLRYVPSRTEDFRLAVVVSKKVSKSAVVRNRIRRRLYESIRRYKADAVWPYDMVVTVFDPSLATMSAVDVDKEVSDLLQKATL